jgi:hypothetical protein
MCQHLEHKRSKEAWQRNNSCTKDMLVRWKTISFWQMNIKKISFLWYLNVPGKIN